MNCKRPANQQVNELALVAVFNPLEDVHRAQVLSIAGGTSEPQAAAVTDARVYVQWNGVEVELTPLSGEPGWYGTSASVWPLQSGDSFRLIAEAGDAVLSSSGTVPAAVNITDNSDQNIIVDPTSTGQPVFEMTWGAAPELLYVLRVDTLTDSHNSIPFEFNPTNFGLYFGLPFEDTNASIWDTDFVYDGLHRLNVFAIHPEFEQVFLYPGNSAASNPLAYPDNVVNGSGYVTAVSQTFITLSVTQ